MIELRRLSPSFGLLLLLLILSCDTVVRRENPANQLMPVAGNTTIINPANADANIITEDRFPEIPSCLNRGCKAPDFVSIATDGQPIQLSKVNTKNIMLLFWLLDCHACESEMPLIQQLRDNLPGEELEILAINVFGDKDKVIDFIARQGYTFRVLLDTEGGIAGIYRDPTFPTIYLLDENRIIIKKRDEAFQSYQEIDDFLTTLPAN